MTGDISPERIVITEDILRYISNHMKDINEVLNIELELEGSYDERSSKAMLGDIPVDRIYNPSP